MACQKGGRTERCANGADPITLRLVKRIMVQNTNLFLFPVTAVFLVFVFVVSVAVKRTLTGSYERARILLMRPKMPSTKRLYLLIRISGTGVTSEAPSVFEAG